ncbi:Integrase-like protein [Gossypium australe]|uniref:Integrase-like protein n=1 Tax=Gossypium australe TaxID=47621 RepID=A0A5B6WTG9_9ROSI|nr:Integrase-like protein [Gossypium australe]
MHFIGTMTEDPNQHLKWFLQLCETLKFNGITDDAIRLQLYPFSFIDNSFTWLDRHERLGLDGATGGALMNKTYVDAYDLIENMPRACEGDRTSFGKVQSSLENPTQEGNKKDTKDLQEEGLQNVVAKPKPKKVTESIDEPKAELNKEPY